MGVELLKNTIWVFKLHFKYAAILTIAQVIGFINSNTNRLFQGFVAGLVIDWIIEYVNGEQDNRLIIYSLSSFGIYYLITGVAYIASNFGNNLNKFKNGICCP